jgi:hypothetical protein
MRTIASYGDEILAAQTAMGLENPKHFAPGLTEAEINSSELFSLVSPDSELGELFRWRNGSSEATGAVVRGGLWLRPGFFMLSARYCYQSNRYRTARFGGRWQASWFPILDDGSTVSRFCDVKAGRGRQLRVFGYDPEALPEVSQIYDSVAAMFHTLLACYKQGVYRIDDTGLLGVDYPAEVALSRRLNPGSAYWSRTDLY